jgi:enoyl-[acyl-carrier protein] reductase I
MVRKYYGLLEGKKGVILGPLNEQSLAWQIALQVYGEGGEFILTNAPVAMRFANLDELSKQCGNAPVVAADVTKDEDVQQLYTEAQTHLAKLTSSCILWVGRKIFGKKYLCNFAYDWYLKTLDISAISLHRIILHALPVLNEGASIVALTYIGAHRIFSNIVI